MSAGHDAASGLTPRQSHSGSSREVADSGPLQASSPKRAVPMYEGLRGTACPYGAIVARFPV
jgi:hypothetical protein